MDLWKDLIFIYGLGWRSTCGQMPLLTPARLNRWSTLKHISCHSTVTVSVQMCVNSSELPITSKVSLRNEGCVLRTYIHSWNAPSLCSLPAGRKLHPFDFWFSKNLHLQLTHNGRIWNDSWENVSWREDTVNGVIRDQLQAWIMWPLVNTQKTLPQCLAAWDRPSVSAPPSCPAIEHLWQVWSRMSRWPYVGERGFQTLDRWNGLMFNSLNSCAASTQPKMVSCVRLHRSLPCFHRAVGKNKIPFCGCWMEGGILRWAKKEATNLTQARRNESLCRKVALFYASQICSCKNCGALQKILIILDSRSACT